MSVFTDLKVRQALNTHMLSIGTQAGTLANERTINLSTLGISGVSGQRVLQIVGGESPPAMKQGLTWVDTFLVKSPQFIRTPSPTGLSQKLYQYGIWVRTDKTYGTFDNEAIAGIIEQHFQNNLHLPVGSDVLTIIKSYQQPIVTADNETGRLFNRVFVDCELYYNNNN